MDTEKYENLVSKYFTYDPPDEEEKTCLYKWCRKKDAGLGYCEYHQQFAEEGIFFTSKEQERKSKHKLRLVDCLVEGCKKKASRFKGYCPRHYYQIKTYGFITTDGNGHHLIERHSNYSVLKVYRPQLKEWFEITLDKGDAYRLKSKGIYLDRDRKPFTILESGMAASVKSFIMNDKKCATILPLDKNEFNLRKHNLACLDSKGHHFIFCMPPIGKYGYRGISYKQCDKKWYCHIFQDNPDLEIKRTFDRKIDAIKFRNIIYKEVYGKHIVKLLQVYCGENKGYGRQEIKVIQED